MTDRVLVAISRYYKDIADELEAGALEVLEAAGARVTTMEVPGAFELPGIAAMAADSGKYDGTVVLGCVIRGETTHYDYVCGESARTHFTEEGFRRLRLLDVGFAQVRSTGLQGAEFGSVLSGPVRRRRE